MTDNDIRILAEKHWRYTEGIILNSGNIPTILDRYLYIESFIHGYKHAKKEVNK